MNTSEIMNDLVNERGAILEIYDAPAPTSKLQLVGAAQVRDATHLVYVMADPKSLTGQTLTFASLNRLHALAVGFYDSHGELIARLAQIRECELDAADSTQFTVQFAYWKKLLADKINGPALLANISQLLSAPIK